MEGRCHLAHQHGVGEGVQLEAALEVAHRLLQVRLRRGLGLQPLPHPEARRVGRRRDDGGAEIEPDADLHEEGEEDRAVAPPLGFLGHGEQRHLQARRVQVRLDDACAHELALAEQADASRPGVFAPERQRGLVQLRKRCPQAFAELR